MQSSFKVFGAAALVLVHAQETVEEPMRYRLYGPGGHLSVTSCEEFVDSMWGDPVGTCGEQGYVSKCLSCHGGTDYFVEKEGSCTQKTTQCYMRAPEETCAGTLECDNVQETVEGPMHYRLYDPDSDVTHLSVTHCEEVVDEWWVVDPVGTCQGQGYVFKCLSCHMHDWDFWVKEEESCTQKTTQCFMRGAWETCDYAHCPDSEVSV